MSRVAFGEPVDHQPAAEMAELEAEEAAFRHPLDASDVEFPPEPDHNMVASDYPEYPPQIRYVRRLDVLPAQGRVNSSTSAHECCGCRVPMLTRCQPMPMWLKIVGIVAIVWMVVFVAPEFLGWQVRLLCCALLVKCLL